MKNVPDQTTRKVKTVCLDPAEPCAREYNDRDVFEQVTINDVTPGLQSMVLTGNVATMTANTSNRYSFPDLSGDDDEAHESVDYSKLVNVDMVERDQFVDDFKNDPKNYEKTENTESEDSSEEGDDPEKANPPKKKGDGAGQ